MELLARGPLRLAFERTGGPGDPLVLIHGGWNDHHLWDRTLAGLGGAFQVLAYDRRGHGESSGPGRARPVRDDSLDLSAVLEVADHYPAHLVGHGYGGAVALRLAVDRPELVRSVVVHEVPFVGLLEGALGVGSTGSVPEQVLEIQRVARSADPERAAQEYLRLFASPSEDWATLDPTIRRTLVAAAPTWAAEMADPEAQRPALEDLAGVAVPVLVTTGGQSPPFAGRIADELVSGLPNATGRTFRDGGHFVPWTDPDLFVGVVGGFLLERNVPST